jgi:hypothetical protein
VTIVTPAADAAPEPRAVLPGREWLDGYRWGCLHGHALGYADAEREMAAAWHAVADPASRGGPSHAEIECRRWGPGGRDRFGDPRPGDYRGRGDAA